jgi:hypothetical protein
LWAVDGCIRQLLDGDVELNGVTGDDVLARRDGAAA